MHMTEHKQDQGKNGVQIPQQVEDTLQDGAIRYRTIIENTFDLICELDQEGQYYYLTPNHYEVLGYTPDELVGCNAFALIHPDDRPRVIAAFQNSSLSGQEIYRFQHKNGEWRWLESIGKGYRSTQQEFRRVIVSRDVTRRRRIEEILHRERSLFTNGPVVIFRWRAHRDWPVEYISPNVTQFGYRAEDLCMGKISYGRLIHPEDREIVAAAVNLYSEAGVGSFEQEYRVLQADGQIRWVYALTAVIRNDENEATHYNGYILDITERRHAQETLHRGEERFALAVRAANDGLWDWDMLTNEVYYAPRFKELLGYKDHEFEPRLESFESRLHPDDHDRVMQTIHQHLERGVPYQEEFRLYPKKSEYRWFEGRGQAIWDLEGKPTRMVGAIRDITERKQTEELLEAQSRKLSLTNQQLQKAQNELERRVEERTRELAATNERLTREMAERKRAEVELKQAKEAAEAANRAKSEFLANMSHELRTPLHGILSFAGFGLKKGLSSPPEKLHRYFRQIDESGRVLLTLLDDLLDLAKLEAGKMVFVVQPVNLTTLLPSVAEEFRFLVAERHLTLHCRLPEAKMVVSLDPDKIKQVVRNLLSNAVKFSAAGGEIELRLQRGAQEVVVEVQDQGVGIPAGEEAQIFDKFIQSSKTKTGAGGTGLGLAICREIITAHHGRIWAERRPEGGALFSFALPLQMDGLPLKEIPRAPYDSGDKEGCPGHTHA